MFSFRAAPITWTLVALNGAAFLLQLVAGGAMLDTRSDTLLRLGGNFAPLVTGGEWWRLPASMFLHGGMLHIAMNMLALVQAGMVVERIYGGARFAALYFGAGLTGALASIFWRQDVVSVGASGAVFGVYGALLAFLTLHRDAIPTLALSQLRTGALLFVGYSLAFGFGVSGIDNAAHLGGLVGGALLGVGLSPGRVSARNRLGAAALRATALSLVALLAAALWNATPDHSADYRRLIVLDQAIEAFAADERLLNVRLQKLQQDQRDRRLTEDQAIAAIERDMLPVWDRHIDALAGLPVKRADKEALRRELLRYATLRRDSLALLAQAIRDDDLAKAEEARRRHAQAQAVLSNLKLHAEQEAKK